MGETGGSAAEFKAAILLVVAAAGAALAIGTVHAVTLCVVASVLAVSTVLAWWNAEPMRVRPAATALLFLGVGLTLYTALQCVPIPIRWLAAIAPQNADVWSQALAPLDESGPRSAPISLDPVASRLEVLKGLAYLFAFLTALRVARRREGIALLSVALVLTGVVIGVIAVLHPALGIHKLYGVYQPGYEIQYRHIAPLLNPNHLAAYLNVAFCISLAAALSPVRAVPQPIAAAVALILFGFELWVASRGGVVAMVVGAAAVLVLTWALRTDSKHPRRWLTIACGAVVFAGMAVLVLGTSNEASFELADRSLSKFRVLLDMPRMVGAYAVWGAGRGTFESTYPRFSHGAWNVTATNPENLLAQWSTEWGVPVTLVALGGLLVALGPTEALARSRAATGAWGALVAVAVQNMADYSSEVPGVMVSVAICAAIVVAGSAGRPASWLGRWPLAPRSIACATAIAAVLGVWGGVTALGRQLGDDQERMRDAALAQGAPIDRIAAVARLTMLRHPSEPYLPYIVAVAAARARDPRVLRWLNATLERGPSYGLAHYVLAHVLAPRAPAQARLEYRLTYEQAGEFEQLVGQEAPALVQGYDDAMELVSKGERGAGMLEALVEALAQRLPATSERLDEQLATRKGASAASQRRAAVAAVADLENAEPWCVGAERPACLERVLFQTRRAQALDPTRCEGYELEGRALVADRRASEALDALQRGADAATDRDECLKALAKAAMAAQDGARLEKAFEQLARCVDRECVGDVMWVGQTEEARGQPRRALIAYKRAQQIAPDDDAVLVNVARLDAVVGLNADALAVYQHLVRLHPTDDRWKNAMEAQRKAIVNF